MKTLFLIGAAVLCLLLSAGEKTDFATFTKPYLSGQKSEGRDQIQLKTLPDGLSVRFGKVLPDVAQVYFRSSAFRTQKFAGGTLTLEMDLPDSMMLRGVLLRMADAKGEVFQFKNPKSGLFPKGRVKLEYAISEKSWQNCWSGDKKIDWPLRLAGVAVILHPKTEPEREIIFRQADLKVHGEFVDVAVATGHPLNLLLPGGEKSPYLQITNVGDTASELQGTIAVTDFLTKKTVQFPVKRTMAPESAAKVVIPGLWTRQGCWLVSVEFHSAKGNLYRTEARVATMDPVGKTPIFGNGFLFGVCSHLMQFTDQQIELEALAMGLCGIKIVRSDIEWRMMEREPGKINFSKLDYSIRKLRENGVELEALLCRSNTWAEIPGKKWPDLDQYAAFAGKIAARYKNDVRYYEIWNEPDHTFFANFPGTHFYQMVKVGYKAIKKEDPEAIVMSGGLAHVWFNDSGSKAHNNGIIELLLADQGAHYDVFGFHGHGSAERYYTELQTLEAKKIIGLGAPRPWYSNETAESSIPIGELNQAKSVYKKFLLAWSKGAIAMNWYVMRNKDKFAGSPNQGWGLITGNFQPKPAYIAYNAVAKNFTHGKFVKTEHYAPDLVLLRFADAQDRDMLGLWCRTGKRFVSVSGIPDGTEMIDLFGNVDKLSPRNGEVFLEINDIPFTLRAPAGKKIAWKINGDIFPVKLPQVVALAPGEKRNVSFAVFNPGKSVMQINTSLQLPRGITAVFPAEISLKPGEQRRIAIPLTADASFRTSYLQPQPVLVQCSINKGKAIVLETKAITKNLGNAPLFEINRKDQYHSLVRGIMLEDGTPLAAVQTPKSDDARRYLWWGPQDLSAKAWLWRESHNIKLKVVVTDDIHFQNSSGWDLYNGDSIQVMIDVPGQTQHWEFCFAKNGQGKDEAVAMYKPLGIPFVPDSVSLKVTRDETRKETIYEVLIPFKAMRMTAAQAAEGIHFNFQVNDHDGKCRKAFFDIHPSRSPMLWPVIDLN